MKLKTVCEINPKCTIPEDCAEVSFIPMQGISDDGKIDLSDVRICGDVKKGYTSFEEDDVLFAKITPCMENGKGAIARGLTNRIGFGSSEFHVLRPNTSMVTSEWLYFLTSWTLFRRDAEKHMTGSAGQKRVPKKYLEDYEVNLPSLREQEQQTNVLSCLRRVIDLRKNELQHLDNLVKARFVEMFGNPINNNKNWPTTELINVVKMQRGFDLPVQDRHTDGGIPVYGSNGILDFHDIAKIKGGGVITGRSGTIGNVYYTKGDYWPLNTTLFSADLHGNDVIYIAYLLQLYDLTRFVEGTGVPTLNRNMFHNKQVMNVPINEQIKFSSFVKQIDKSKVAVQKSLEETQLLFDKLMQEYFG